MHTNGSSTASDGSPTTAPVCRSITKPSSPGIPVLQPPGSIVRGGAVVAAMGESGSGSGSGLVPAVLPLLDALVVLALAEVLATDALGEGSEPVPALAGDYKVGNTWADTH